MKKFRTVLAIACVAIMTIACLAMTGCGVDGSYKFSMSKEDYMEAQEVKDFYAQPSNMIYSMVHGQMISNFADTTDDAYTAELTLNKGEYTYYKGFKMLDSYVNSFGYAMTFYGTYEEKDGEITLSVPTRVVANAYTWLSGADTALTKDQEYTENNDDTKLYFNMFNGKFLTISEAKPMTVTVDSKTGTFEIK